MSKPIFITNPHGAQELRYTEDKSMRHGQRVGNMLFTLYDKTTVTRRPGEEAFQVTMTGEELDSLCDQWTRFRNLYSDTV
jgi:hypothetical protein